MLANAVVAEDVAAWERVRGLAHLEGLLVFGLVLRVGTVVVPHVTILMPVRLGRLQRCL